MNVGLAKKVVEHLKKEPERFVMASVFDPGGDLPRGGGTVTCGTASCIAGLAATISLEEADATVQSTAYTDAWYAAEEALCLTKPEALSLFLISNWPYKYLCRAMEVAGDLECTIDERSLPLRSITWRS